MGRVVISGARGRVATEAVGTRFSGVGFSAAGFFVMAVADVAVLAFPSTGAAVAALVAEAGDATAFSASAGLAARTSVTLAGRAEEGLLAVCGRRGVVLCWRVAVDFFAIRVSRAPNACL